MKVFIPFSVKTLTQLHPELETSRVVLGLRIKITNKTLLNQL